LPGRFARPPPKIFEKGIDKAKNSCYNKEKNKGENIMRFRVVHPAYMPTYFRTRRAAELFRQAVGGTIERKIGDGWFE
jgi:hypothetical protein